VQKIKYGNLILFSFCLVLQQAAIAQRADTIQCEVKALTTLPKSLTEISGMVYTKDGLWTHNDSGNGAYIMLLKQDGTIKTIKQLASASNYDWEDIAQDPKGNLYVGDIGNNNNTRRALQIYQLPNPFNSEEQRIESQKIEFEYPDQKEFPPKNNRLVYDAEALVYFNDSLFIFNKNRTLPFDGYLRVYKIPALPGKQKALLADSVYLGGKNSLTSWVTGADISRDGNKLALLSHDKIWVFKNFKGSDFFNGKLCVLKLNHFSQKEAICFDDEGNLLVADELFERVLGGKLYSILPLK
jgi:hypothetical protein